MTLPPEEYAEAWDVVIDTGGSADEDEAAQGRVHLRDRQPQPRRAARAQQPETEPDHSVAASVAQAQASGDRRAGARPRTYRLQVTPDVRPARGRAAAAVPARPGRRLGLPVAAAGGRARQPARLRRGRVRPGRPRPRRGRGARRAVGRGPAARHGRARRHRAQPRRRRDAGRERRGGGTCCGTAATPRTRRRSTSTGRPATAGSWCRSWATATRARSRIDGRARLRYHDHRFPLGARHDARSRSSTTSWCPGGAADAELNYRRFFAVNTLAGVRVEDPEVFDETHAEIRRWFDRGPRRRPARRPPRRAARPEALPRRPRRAHRRRLRAGGEDPRARRAAAADWATQAPPATTRSRWSTGCSPTRPARSRSTPSRPGCAVRRSTGRRWSTTTSAPSPTASCSPRSGGSAARSWHR